MKNLGNERNLYDPNALDSKVLSGMFTDRESTERAYNNLIAKGYSLEDISILMSDFTRENHFNYMKSETDFGAKVAEIGGIDCELGGTVIALGSLGIPESRIKSYYSGIKDGNVVIIVVPKDEADAIYFLNKWKTNRGEEVHY